MGKVHCSALKGSNMNDQEIIKVIENLIAFAVIFCLIAFDCNKKGHSGIAW